MTEIEMDFPGFVCPKAHYKTCTDFPKSCHEKFVWSDVFKKISYEEWICSNSGVTSVSMYYYRMPLKNCQGIATSCLPWKNLCH